jgi:hypothetical protein
MAEQDGLPWRTLAEVEGVARGFLDPLLGVAIDASWDPISRFWRRSADDRQIAKRKTRERG